MHSTDRRKVLTLLAQAGIPLALGTPRLASAQETVPLLKILFGYPPAGVGALVTQGLGEKMAGTYARSVIVDSRPGAAGRLVLDAVKASPADGSALFVSPSSVLAMYPHVYSKLSYDPFSDIQPVSTICEFVHGLAVGPGVPESVKTVADFVAWGKANPGKTNIANPGEGSLPHFLTMLLSKAVGLKFESIAYAGGPPGVKDTLGGQVAAMIATEGQFITYYRAGQLRLLATSGAQRSRFSPEVPTFTEQGYKDIQVSEWIGMFAPAKVPAAQVARANQAVRSALAHPDLADNFSKFAIHPLASSPADLGKRLKADHDFWGPVVKSTGFTPLS